MPRLPNSLVLLVLFFIIYSITAFIPKQPGVMKTYGDEAHYLIASYSLLHDKDLKLENNYKNKSYKNWYAENLVPHLITLNEKKYPLHQPGLSVYILPAFAVAERPSVLLFLALLSSIAMVNIYRTLLYFCKKKLAVITTLFVGLSVPVFTYSTLIYPETFALFLLSWLGLILFNPAFKLTLKNGLAIILLSVLLPPLHVKFILLVGLMMVYVVVTSYKKVKLLNLIFLNIAVGLGIVAYLIWAYLFYGSDGATALRGIAGGNSFHVKYIFSGILANLVDRENGILLFAPLYIFIFSGTAFFLQNLKKMTSDKKIGRLFIFGTMLIWIFFVTMYPHIIGGENPAGRYLLPIIPAFATMLALGLEQAFKNKLQTIVCYVFMGYTLLISTVIAYNTFLSIPVGGGNNIAQFLLRDNSVIIHKILPNLSKFFREITLYDFAKGISIFSLLLAVSVYPYYGSIKKFLLNFLFSTNKTISTTLSNLPWKKIPMLLFIFLFAFYLLSVFFPKPQGMSLANGDEPHYLIATYSLVHDNDLELMGNYKNADYEEWYAETTLDHHLFTVDGKKWYPIHQVGLSFYILPFFALFGRVGANMMMALVTSLAMVQIYHLLLYFVKNKIAFFTTVLIGITAPIFAYSGLIYPEVCIFFIMACILRIILNPKYELNLKTGILLTILFTLMPPLHFKFGILMAILLPYITIISLKKTRWYYVVLFNGVIGAFSAAYLVWFYFFVDMNLSVALTKMGGGGNILLQNFPSGLLGQLVDRENGVLIYSPIWIYVFIGFQYFYAQFSKKTPAEKGRILFLSILIGIHTLFISSYKDIISGQNPGARYFLPILPALAIVLAIGLRNVLTFWIHRFIISAFTLYSIIISLTIMYNPMAAMPFGGDSPLFNYMLGSNARYIHPFLPNLSKFRRELELIDYLKGFAVFGVFLSLTYIHELLRVFKHVRNITKSPRINQRQSKKRKHN